MTLDGSGLLMIAALASGLGAAAIIVWYLVRRPPLDRHTKVWLLFGLGPLPIAAALTGNGANYEVTMDREFCGSCHVMVPYTEDAANIDSRSLASLHSRSPWFGEQSCYTCHADYGMFGTVLTKIGGMHHVWDYYTGDWDAPGHRAPALYKPYSNTTCLQCHPQLGPHTPMEHKVHAGKIADGTVSCASAGCHGPPHPPFPTTPVAHAEGAQ